MTDNEREILEKEAQEAAVVDEPEEVDDDDDSDEDEDEPEEE